MQGLLYHQPYQGGLSHGIILSSIFKGMDSQLSIHWITSIRTAEPTRKRSRSTGIHNGVNWKWSSYPGIKLCLVGCVFRVFQVLWAAGSCSRNNIAFHTFSEQGVSSQWFTWANQTLHPWNYSGERNVPEQRGILCQHYTCLRNNGLEKKTLL